MHDFQNKHNKISTVAVQRHWSQLIAQSSTAALPWEDLPKKTSYLISGTTQKGEWGPTKAEGFGLSSTK